MGNIKIKGPNADEIFDKFKHKTGNRKQLEKHYGIKKAAFNVDNVTAAEYVKNVLKEAVFFFQVDVNIKPSGKVEVLKEPYNTLEKTKFYIFKKPIAKSDWKGDKTVPMADTIKEISCGTCRGSGKKNCKKCNGDGTIKCSDCKGTGKISCDKCVGKGKQFIEVTVINDEGKKNKRKIEYSCPECFGSGKLTCPKCKGITKDLCKTCKGEGSEPCEDCDGSGSLWQYELQPVPFLEERSIMPFLFSSGKLDKDVEKRMGTDLNKLLEKVNGIQLKTLNDLNKKIVEPNLGYIDKNIEKAIKNAQKELEGYDKMDGYKPIMPIYLFPLLNLECVTAKGKKYSVYSIGSDMGFLVFGDLP